MYDSIWLLTFTHLVRPASPFVRHYWTERGGSADGDCVRQAIPEAQTVLKKALRAEQLLRSAQSLHDIQGVLLRRCHALETSGLSPRSEVALYYINRRFGSTFAVCCESNYRAKERATNHVDFDKSCSQAYNYRWAFPGGAKHLLRERKNSNGATARLVAAIPSPSMPSHNARCILNVHTRILNESHMHSWLQNTALL